MLNYLALRLARFLVPLLVALLVQSWGVLSALLLVKVSEANEYQSFFIAVKLYLSVVGYSPDFFKRKMFKKRINQLFSSRD